MRIFLNPFESLLSEIRTSLPPVSAQQIEVLLSDYCQHLAGLRLVPPEDILSEDEVRILHALESSPEPKVSLPHRSLVLILKATRLCNLRCTYCNSWRSGPGQVMDFGTLATLMRETLLTPGLHKLQIVWHGGEVTLLPKEYVKKALWLQERFRSATVTVDNCIQTNGTLLTPDWVDFLAAHRISVGVSVDASPAIHDLRRLTKAGRGTWSATLQGIENLRKANIPFGVLAVVDEHAIALGAEAYLEQLAALNVRGVALLNALPANEPDRPNSSAYLAWDQFQLFLRELFAIWWSKHRSSFELRELQALVDAVQGGTHGLCIYAGNCMGKYLTVEPDGRISACEKYVGNPDYEFGRLGEDGGLGAMLERSPRLAQAAATVDRQKAAAANICDYYRYCSGGCPHDDLNNTRFGQPSGQCCGMRDLIDDIRRAVSKEENDHGCSNGDDAVGIDLWTGCK